MNGEVLIRVSDLHVRYGAFEAVRGVSFTLSRGEILGLVGESGSGKSTIAKTLIGLERASGGEIVFPSARPTLQMIFQDAVGSLNPRMTIRQILDEVLTQKRRELYHADRVKEISSLLARVGLSEAVLSQYPHELSGGQCQRISVARALACRPDILIADEPVSALDVSVQARILNLLRDLRIKENLTILLIAHDLAVVRNVSDNIVVLEKGLAVDAGTTDEVFAHPKGELTKRLLASSRIATLEGAEK